MGRQKRSTLMMRTARGATAPDVSHMCAYGFSSRTSNQWMHRLFLSSTTVVTKA
jgi:hypothetical protein